MSMNDNKPIETISLHEIQGHLAKACKKNGWDKNSISEVFLLLNEEIGELAKGIRKHTGFKGEKKETSTDNIEEELADVLNYVLEIANRFSIDLAEAYFKKHKINQKRTWQ